MYYPVCTIIGGQPPSHRDSTIIPAQHFPTLPMDGCLNRLEGGYPQNPESRVNQLKSPCPGPSLKQDRMSIDAVEGKTYKYIHKKTQLKT